MPAREQSLAVTDAYRERLLDLRLRATRQSAVLWANVSRESLDDSYEAWLAAMVAVTAAFKRQGVLLTDAYLAAYVAAETRGTPQPVGLDPEAYEETVDGRTLEAALATPLMTVKRAVSDGRSDALSLGLVRATRIIGEETLDAPRRALGDLMSERDEVDGWRRVTSSQPCGACLAAADGRVHNPGEPFRRHTSCRCTREAVVRGVPDTLQRPTGREAFDRMSPTEQAALFTGRGGEEKADLVRTGAVPLDALIKREDQAVMPDQFTEASTADLRRMALAAGLTS